MIGHAPVLLNAIPHGQLDPVTQCPRSLFTHNSCLLPVMIAMVILLFLFACQLRKKVPVVGNWVVLMLINRCLCHRKSFSSPVKKFNWLLGLNRHHRENFSGSYWLVLLIYFCCVVPTWVESYHFKVPRAFTQPWRKKFPIKANSFLPSAGSNETSTYYNPPLVLRFKKINAFQIVNPRLVDIFVNIYLLIFKSSQKCKMMYFNTPTVWTTFQTNPASPTPH